MSTIVYRNAMMLLNGAELTGALHELAIEYAAEILDRTVMGMDTRAKQGGLFTGKASGKGYFDTTVGIEAVLFPQVGTDSNATSNRAYQSSAQLEDTLLLLFPDGVTEGSSAAGSGYAMKCQLSTLKLGGTVGTELNVEFAAESRGISA
jgi:hypothetical protein